MFDESKFNSMVKYADMNYWFIRKMNHEFKVIDKTAGIEIGTYVQGVGFNPISTAGDITDTISPNVVSAFDQFKTRPEYLVGKHFDITDDNQEVRIGIYESLLTGVALIKANPDGLTDPDSKTKRIFNALTWIRNSDFYNAPASTQYHEAYVGGLLHHTLTVYNKAIELLSLPTFADKLTFDSVAIAALAHDWCKIGLYESYLRNVKNDDTGKWEQVTAFRHHQVGVPLGHGVSSMFIASRLFSVTTEEAVAIRWHMGAWRVVDSEMNELQMANETYPLVHLLQFADQLAIVNY